MNTDSFQSETNRLACSLERDMRSACAIGRGSEGGADASLLPPLTAAEFQSMSTLLALQGRDGALSQHTQSFLDQLVKRYKYNGGTFPLPSVNIPDPDGAQPTAGSFHTHSIDNIWDLLNFIKGSAIILLGSSVNPSLIIPANVFVFASFIYAVRNHILKFIFKIKYT